MAAYSLASVIVVSTGLFLFGVSGEPQRIWATLLVGGFGLLGLGLGAAIFLALLIVTGARWSQPLQPAAERLTRLAATGAVIVTAVLLAAPELYPWSTAAESLVGFQAFWLTRPFFLLRSFAYLVIWLGLVFWLVRAARQSDLASRARIAAGFLVVFAITCWLASVDWIMSLEPHWNSTAFGVYQFAGMFLGALAALIVLVIGGRERGQLDKSHFRDLGTLLFSFSSFWMYIWFCQYMLIWYVNSPEETPYYVRRLQEAWQPLFLANLVLNWGVPFVVLIFRSAKECSCVLFTVAVIVLLGRCLDLYLMVVPATRLDPSPWDACLGLGIAALAALVLLRPRSASSIMSASAQ
jgi:hypothetical protein